MVRVAVFVARILIGALLVVAGVLKAHDGPNATALSIAAYRILPSFPVKLLGVVLPYLEILLGAYLCIGLFTRVAAWVATAQFAVFAAAVASLVIRNLPADCGCFGSRHSDAAVVGSRSGRRRPSGRYGRDRIFRAGRARDR